MNARRKRGRLIEAYGEKCAFCGAVEDLTVDHIRPLAAGGNGQFHNLQLLCYPCNQEKADTGPGGGSA